MNNFDSVAWFYDRLSKLIFGKAMHRAQTAYLTDIIQGGNVLILGGGSGWILSHLFAVNPTCKVWFIDASVKMIRLAKKEARNSSQEIVFVHGTESSIPDDITFDAVVTHFYLDLFPQDSCRSAIHKIRSSIRSNGIWLISDFVNTTWWHGVMLFIMYGFFKLMCGIEASALPKWKNLLEQNGLIEAKSQQFFRAFIRTAVFRKIC